MTFNRGSMRLTTHSEHSTIYAQVGSAHAHRVYGGLSQEQTRTEFESRMIYTAP